MYDHNYRGTAKAVADAWSDYLRQPVGTGDDLLALGAHSLMMALVADRLETDLGVAVPMELCFDAPLFDDYATEIHRLRGAEPISA